MHCGFWIAWPIHETDHSSFKQKNGRMLSLNCPCQKQPNLEDVWRPDSRSLPYCHITTIYLECAMSVWLIQRYRQWSHSFYWCNVTSLLSVVSMGAILRSCNLLFSPILPELTSLFFLLFIHNTGNFCSALWNSWILIYKYVNDWHKVDVE